MSVGLIDRTTEASLLVCVSMRYPFCLYRTSLASVRVSEVL
jgi:hypothetical protein